MLPVKETDYWETPDKEFRIFNNIFGFTLDAAATPKNAKCPTFFTEADDGLSQSWAGHRVWCNPPYSRGHLPAWTAKALEEARLHRVLACLFIPHETSTRWWWNNVVANSKPGQSPLGLRGCYAFDHTWGQVVVAPVAKRVRFLRDGKEQGGARFPSAAVIYLPS